MTETLVLHPAPSAAPAVKAITCPSCGGSIALRAAGYSVTLVCQYCGSILDVANPDVRLITQFSQAASRLELPLGAHGVVQGLEFEVLGYMRRSSADGAWEEYLLFNPYEGFRWLVRDEGTWSLGVMLTTLPKHLPGSEMIYAGQRFRRQDAPSEARVDYVLGEFYWRVQVGEKVMAETYGGHGADLSSERNADETNWTLITPLREDVVAAFGGGHPGATATVEGQAVSTSGAKAPFGSLRHLFLVGAVTTGLLLVVMIAFSGGAPSQTMQFSVTPDGAPRTLTVGRITLPRASQRVTLTSRSSRFENMWIDLDYSLIERTNQKRLDVSGTIEHYSGSDSDGPWTEGSYENKVSVSSVPKGVYDVVVEASAHRWSDTGSSSSSSSSTSTTQGGWDAPGAAGNDLAVEVTSASGGVFPGNFWLALLLIFLPLGVRLVFDMRKKK